MKKKFMSTKIKVFITILIVLCLGCYTAGAVVLSNSGYCFHDYFDWDNVWDNFDFHFSFFSNHEDEGDLTVEYQKDLTDINITTSSGDVKVKFDNSSKIRLHLSGYFADGRNYKDGINEFKINNDNLNLTTDEGSVSKNLKLTLYVPSEYKNNLTINTKSGDIEVSDSTLNDITIQTSSGNISCDNGSLICNDLQFNTTSGDMKISNLTAKSTTIASTSGKLTLSGNLGKVAINSTSGDIKINDFKDVNANCEIASHSGDIELTLPDINDYKLNFTSNSGDFKSNNDNYEKNGKHDYTVTNGNGNYIINISTTSGDFKLKN